MGAYEDLAQVLRQTQVMQQVLTELEKEPVTLLLAICREYEATKEAVPDHHLHLSGYLGEVAMRVLLEAGLIERQPGRRLSVNSYEPTSAGTEYYRKLKGERPS